MKLIIIFLLLVPVFSIAQPDTSLCKYSYLIAGSTIDSNGQKIIIAGTGFFMKDGTELLFITAEHVITGCKYHKTTSDVYPRSLYIFIHDPAGNTVQQHRIRIDSMRAEKPCGNVRKNPDIAVIHITDSLLKFPVYTVNELMSSYSNILHLNAIIYGYAAKRFAEKIWQNALPEAIVVNGPESYIYFNYRLGDRVHYDIKTRALAEYGYSGSPVFIFDNTKWKLAGVVVAIDGYGKPARQRIIVSKQNYILNIPRLLLKEGLDEDR